MSAPFKTPIKVAEYNPVDDAVLVDAAGNEILGVSEWLRCDAAVLDHIVAVVNAPEHPAYWEQLAFDLAKLLVEVRADGVMEEWANDLPSRIDAVLKLIDERPNRHGEVIR